MLSSFYPQKKVPSYYKGRGTKKVVCNEAVGAYKIHTALQAKEEHRHLKDAVRKSEIESVICLMITLLSFG
jgi:hypothetical protein